MLVPAITSTGIPACSSTFNTPICARPRAAPPLRAMPILGVCAYAGSMAPPVRAGSTRPSVSPSRGGRIGHPIVARPGAAMQRTVAASLWPRAQNCCAPAPFCEARRVTMPCEMGSTQFANRPRRFRYCEATSPLCSVGGSLTAGKAWVGGWCGSVVVMRSRWRSSGAAVSTAGRAWRGAPGETAAAAGNGVGADPAAPPSELRTHHRFFPRHFERTPPGVFPGDGEQAVAARARDLERMLAQGRAGTALRADAVARSPGEGRLRRVGDARDDGPELGAKRENLQEGARDRDEAAIHFEHTLGGGGAHHAIPRAAS